MNNRAGSDIDKDFQTQFCLDKQMLLKKCELLIYTCSFCLKTSKNKDYAPKARFYVSHCLLYL